MTGAMNRNKLWRKLLLFLCIIFVLCISLIGYGVYWAFFDMNRLPTGEYLTEETSPEGTYTMKAYLTNGGATTPFANRGELVFNKENNKSKNIYWNAHEEVAEIDWEDDDTVIINGHMLHVPGDKYDFRNNR